MHFVAGLGEKKVRCIQAGRIRKRVGGPNTKLGGWVIVMAVAGGAIFPQLLEFIAKRTGSYVDTRWCCRLISSWRCAASLVRARRESR
jgi:hypothetical protein